MFSEFGLLKNGTVVDIRPLEAGELPLVFKDGSWCTFEGKLGEISDSKPITEFEAMSLVSKS